MSKGMSRAISVTGIFLLTLSVVWAADIWKVVDENGNVVYTDKTPKDGSKPMELPELSIIETDFQVEQKPTVEDKVVPPTRVDLPRLYRDFRITRPLPEETFWGTANSVVVTWDSSTPLTPDLSVRLFVDGKAQEAPLTGGVSLILDRGEHNVSAELRDAGNRRIIRTESVTFFVQQGSRNIRRSGNIPSSGSG